jgi:hypothetical protein
MTFLESTINTFKQVDPRLDIWRRYPAVSQEEDELTDQFACGEVSRLFIAFARARGWKAQLIRTDDDPEVGEHFWVRLDAGGLGTIDVDWTARQFHNLEDPDAALRALDAPWPLHWESENSHPVLGMGVTGIPVPD